MDVLLATFQGVTIEACSTGHVGQVKVFEQLSALVRTLAAAPPEFIAANRAHTEKALQNLVLGEFGSREGLMTGPFLELVRDAFTLLYVHGDSKDMLALAGEFQDTVSKNKKGLTSAQAAACMYALAGISRSRGKNLSGHLVDTVAITETTLTPRSKQTLMKLASLAVSSISSVTATSPALRLATVNALVDGVVGAGEAGRSNWPGALRVLARASAVKSSEAVRESGLRGLIALANLSPEPVEKLATTIVASLSDSALSVRMLAAEALGACLGAYRRDVQWSSASPSLLEGFGQTKKVSLDSLSWKTPLPEAFDCLVNAFHSSSSSDFKQAICRTFVVFLDLVAPAKSVDDVVVQIDWALRLASTDATPDKSENVAFASYVLRAGIGSKAPERLQLAASKHLIDICASAEVRAGTKRCALIELQHFIATLGEGFTSLVESCAKTCESITPDTSALLTEASAVLRAIVVSVPESSSSISSGLLEALVMSQADVNKIDRPVRSLCGVVRAAASVNRGGALPFTHLFGMGKALASRHLDQDSDPTGQFGAAGWDLLDSLLTLGPSFYAPHLPQLFALWQETLRSSKNENVLSSCVTALAGLLRNANEDDFALLGRATSSLLISIPISFILKRSVRFQACILECWSKCVASEEKQDPNILLLALHHITAPDARTSFLEPGGLLNAQDDVLDFDSDTHYTLADGKPVDSFMEYHLFKANTSASAQECCDCFDTCADLHALVGRRARSRPSLGQRLKSAGGIGGGHSEATLPPADPRAIPYGQTWSQRAVDASIAYFAAYFSRADDRVKLEALNALISKFGGIPHHGGGSSQGGSGSGSASGASMAAVQPKAFNVAACLLASMRLCETEPGAQREISDWQTIQRDFLVNFLASSQSAIRRAAAQALSIFSIKLASPEISSSVQMFLEGVLKSSADDAHTNFQKCGALLASARMKREGKETFAFAPSESTVYDACKMTTQPVRVWSLHAWNVIVSATNPSEAQRYVRPTTALINAHLLAEAGSVTHESLSAHSATLFCLARLCNTVLSCLGPELSSDEDRATRLFSVWDVLRKSPSVEIQRQCVYFCELFALFHPKFIFEDAYRKSTVTSFVLNCLNAHRENLNAVFAAAVTCVLRLCERDSAFSSNRSRVFESLERCGRAYPSPAMAVISPTLGPWAMRWAWAKSEMTGAPGLSCSSRWSYFYPPEREEQVCYVVAEMIRTGGSKVLNDWFAFCRDVVSGAGVATAVVEEEEPETADEEVQGKSSKGGAGDMLEDEGAAMMREPRWQTRTVALEGLHAVVRGARASGAEHMDLKRARESGEAEPLVKKLEALVSCAGQAATATVGDVGISTLQARGLACLSRIVTIFAPQNDPDVPEFPLLRQYEAQLNATLRPGLSPKAQPELSREATILAANVLVTGVSTSARRLIGQLVVRGMGGEDEEKDEEKDMFAQAEAEEEKARQEAEGKKAILASVFETIDDVATTGLLLAKCSALARLALAAAGRAAAAFEDDVAPSDQVFREDAQSAIAKALTPKIHQALVKMWVRIVRDYFILSASSTLRAPKRHPDATYESGRTPEDVAALLPAYSETWMVCAQAAADAVDGPVWGTLTERDFHVLVFGCARTVEVEEHPVRAINALATLITKDAWKKLDHAFERELIEVLAARAVKANSRGRKHNKEACLNCIAVLVGASGQTLFDKGGDSAERLWVKVFEMSVQACVGSKSEPLARLGLAEHCPSTLYPYVLVALSSAVKKNEPLDLCLGILQTVRKGVKDDSLITAFLADMIDKADIASTAAVLSFATASQMALSQQTHERMLQKMSVLFKTGSLDQKRVGLKSIGDMFRRGLVQQGRFYARELSTDMFAFFTLDMSTLDTFKGMLEIWARIAVMGGLETDGLLALAQALSQDPTRTTDEKRVGAWGKFFLLVARENPVAFKTLVSRCEPGVKAVLEETVRSVMGRQ